jgi:hypothetical protein
MELPHRVVSRVDMVSLESSPFQILWQSAAESISYNLNGNRAREPRVVLFSTRCLVGHLQRGGSAEQFSCLGE